MIDAPTRGGIQSRCPPSSPTREVTRERDEANLVGIGLLGFIDVFQTKKFSSDEIQNLFFSVLSLGYFNLNLEDEA